MLRLRRCQYRWCLQSRWTRCRRSPSPCFCDGDVEFLRVPGGVEIYVGGFCVESVRRKDLPRYRWAIGHWVVDLEVLNKSQASRIFGVSPTSVHRWVKDYEQYGLPGLLSRGPGRPREIPEGARRRIVELRERLGWSVEATTQAVREEYGLPRLGTGMVALISREARARGEEVAVSTGPWPGCSSDGAVPPEIEPYLAPAEAPGTDAPSPDPCDTDPDVEPTVEEDSLARSEAMPALEPVASGREAAYKALLKAGSPITYAGGYLVAALLGQLGLVSVLRDLGLRLDKELPPKRTDNRFWDLPRVLLTMVYGYLFSFGSVEALKTAHQRSLGLLVGAPSAPERNVIRRLLHQAARSGLGRVLGDALTGAYIRLGWVKVAALYIDGHFRPYYGHRRLAYGWFSGRNRPHPGFYEYAVNDVEGRPVFVRLFPASESMTALLPGIVDDALAYCRNENIERHPLVVFDRGGFSAEVFKAMDERHVPFLTYQKGASRYPEGLFSESVWVEDTHGGRRYEYFGTTVPVTGYADEVRAIVVRDPADGGQVTILTNSNRVRPPDRSGRPCRRRFGSKFLIRTMFGRWKQENFFKSAKAHVALDQTASRDFAPAPAAALVPNPERKTLTSERAALEARLANVNEALADLAAPRPTGTKRRRRKSKAPQARTHRGLVAERKRLLEQVADLARRVSQTPDHIRQDELPASKQHKILSLQYQEIFENLKLCAHNVFQMLLATFRGVYRDRRDPAPVLRSLMRQPARVQLSKGTLIVAIEAPSTPAYARALRALVDELNDRAPVTTDAHALPISLEVVDSAISAIKFMDQSPEIMDPAET